MTRLRSLLVLSLVTLGSIPAQGTAPPCQPCAGIQVDDPRSWAALLDEGLPLGEEARLYLAWNVELDGTAQSKDLAAVEASGATPWLRLQFRAEPPLQEGSEALDLELAEAVRIARQAKVRPHFQVLWAPAGGADVSTSGAEYAYLFKRASSALAGANRETRVTTAPLPADPAFLRDFYSRETSAYLDGLALANPRAEGLKSLLAVLTELDPGRPLVIDALELPVPAVESLAEAARFAALGASLTFFRTDTPTAEAIAPFRLLANEFQGDVSLDPYSTPESAGEAWSFVRGEDLGLRVIARGDPEAEELVLRFDDPMLTRPARYGEDGTTTDLYRLRRIAGGLEIRVPDPGNVVVLRIDRSIPSELEGLKTEQEHLDVSDRRVMPVEEILRRLQAFEDAQIRKVHHYRARNTTSLRFAASGSGAVETTFRGAFFFRQGEGFDWAWEELLINGVRWRDKRIPDIPLLQPEKAAALPLEIHFGKRYAYELRGSDVIDGRDCWKVDFEPSGEGADEEGKLYRGTVWIDKELFARVKTRAVQLGLEGEVLSNEEAVFWKPLDELGQELPWDGTGHWIPVRVLGQQLISFLGATLVVEKETTLSDVRINGSDFDTERDEVLASDLTMVRDTDLGLRYLVKDDEGERVVQEEFDNDRFFLVGGLFYDDSFDYPLPLIGANFLSFDFRGTGNQLNVFFAGALLTVNYTDPAVGESRFNLGASVFGIAFPFTDSVFRDEVEIIDEEVRVVPANFELKIGHPIGHFLKVDATYNLTSLHYRRGDDMDPEFVVPSDHLVNSFGLSGRLARSGYRFSFGSSYNLRTEWEPWGFVDDPKDIEAAEDYLRWNATLSKTWFLKKFRRVGVELNYVGGQDLDRFSKYGFGFFGDTRVRGFQTGKVKAEEAWLAHLNYGIGIGEIFRVDLNGDIALATDFEAGFDNELLAGIGISGTVIGPWRTIINLDIGVPVEGPDDGFVAFIAFLKLFK